jgi:hypothetical protein
MNLCIVFLAAEWKLKFKTARRNGKQRGYFTKVINCPCYIIVKYVPHKKQILGNLQFWLVFFNIDIWYFFFFDLFCLAWDGWQSISWKQIYNEHSCILILEIYFSLRSLQNKYDYNCCLWNVSEFMISTYFFCVWVLLHLVQVSIVILKSPRFRQEFKNRIDLILIFSKKKIIAFQKA